jgi:hypothetical protein
MEDPSVYLDRLRDANNIPDPLRSSSGSSSSGNNIQQQQQQQQPEPPLQSTTTTTTTSRPPLTVYLENSGVINEDGVHARSRIEELFDRQRIDPIGDIGAMGRGPPVDDVETMTRLITYILKTKPASKEIFGDIDFQHKNAEEIKKILQYAQMTVDVFEIDKKSQNQLDLIVRAIENVVPAIASKNPTLRSFATAFMDTVKTQHEAISGKDYQLKQLMYLAEHGPEGCNMDAPCRPDGFARIKDFLTNLSVPLVVAMSTLTINRVVNWSGEGEEGGEKRQIEEEGGEAAVVKKLRPNDDDDE